MYLVKLGKRYINLDRVSQVLPDGDACFELVDTSRRTVPLTAAESADLRRHLPDAGDPPAPARRPPARPPLRRLLDAAAYHDFLDREEPPGPGGVP